MKFNLFERFSFYCMLLSAVVTWWCWFHKLGSLAIGFNAVAFVLNLASIVAAYVVFRKEKRVVDREHLLSSMLRPRR